MKKQGFTLIELLIVVAIIAILAAIAVPNFLEAQVRAKVVSVRNDFRNILQAHEAYRVDWGKYPPDKAGNGVGTNWYNDYRNFIFLTTPIAYMSSIPTNKFFDITQSNSGAGTSTELNRGSYSYWGESDGGVYNKDLGVYWHCTSCGPDAKSNMGGTQLNAFAVKQRLKNFVDALYDPTNGTVSSGDLHVCNLGVSLP